MSLIFILRKIKNFLFFFDIYENKYIDLPDQLVKFKLKNKVPNVVFQTWVNSSIPRRMFKGIEEFRNINYDYSFLLYNDADRDKYMKKSWGDREIYQIYKNSVFQASKADIWRYCILYDKGGYYFDIKSSCETPLSKLNVSRGASMTHEPHNTFILPSFELLTENKTFDLNVIANWGFGFKKNHPLLKIQIENIEKFSKFFKGKVFQNPKANILAFTGPGMLTKSYRDYLKIYKKKISFNGIDFNGRGIYQVKGSRYRYKQSISYAGIKNSKILI